MTIELRGDAPGTREGGILDHLLHELEIRCPVSSIPDRLLVNINALGLGDAITVADLELPDRAEAMAEPHAVVVHCVAPMEQPEEEEEGLAGSAEPEVIGRREGEAGEGEGEG